MTSTVASSANSWGPFCKQIVSTLRHAWYQEMHSHQEISQFSHIPVFLKTALAHWPCDIPSLRPHIRHWHRLHGHCGRRNPLRRSLQAAGTHLSTHGATSADATLIQALGAHHGVVAPGGLRVPRNAGHTCCRSPNRLPADACRLDKCAEASNVKCGMATPTFPGCSVLAMAHYSKQVPAVQVKGVPNRLPLRGAAHHS